MPTIEQIRAARALIGWSQEELAIQSGLSQTGVARIESGMNHPNSATMNKIINAFDAYDVEFIGENGVKKRGNEIKKFSGKSGLIEFMNDVYETAKISDGKFSFYNVKPGNWVEVLGNDWWNSHVDRMQNYTKKENVRILVPEGNRNFISNKYATYRWFTKVSKLNTNKTMYIYGGKLAFVTFNNNPGNIEILTLNNKDFAQGVEVLFDITWEQSKTPTA
ncbi:MAG: helix-turn-helix domain-containing protein [Alphaproteobacteria bacterium]